jgi:hypothetical protein
LLISGGTKEIITGQDYNFGHRNLKYQDGSIESPGDGSEGISRRRSTHEEYAGRVWVPETSQTARRTKTEAPM